MRKRPFPVAQLIYIRRFYGQQGVLQTVIREVNRENNPGQSTCSRSSVNPTNKALSCTSHHCMSALRQRVAKGEDAILFTRSSRIALRTSLSSHNSTFRAPCWLIGVLCFLDLAYHLLERFGNVNIASRACFNKGTLEFLGQLLALSNSHLSLRLFKITLVADDGGWHPVRPLLALVITASR